MATGASWEDWQKTAEASRHYVLKATSTVSSATHWHGLYLTTLREKLAASGGRKFCIVIWSRESGAYVLPVDWYILNIANRARSEEGGRLVGHRHLPDRSFGVGTDPGRVRIPEETMRPYFFATPAQAHSLLEDDSPLDPRLKLEPPPPISKPPKKEPVPSRDSQGQVEKKEAAVATDEEIPPGMLLQAEFERLVTTAGQDAGIEQDAREVREKYGPMFAPSGISALVADKFKAFLTYKENRHWSGINRHSGALTEDLALLKKALAVLVDETKPVSDRIDGARGMINGLGKAVLSAILQVAYPAKYGVYNEVSEKGLRQIGLHPEASVSRFGSLSMGKQYEHVNRVLNELSAKYDVTLWALDAVWGHLGGTNRFEPLDSAPEAQSAWWVNQGSTYSNAKLHGRLWAPKLAQDGRPRDFWTRLTALRVGDLILHYSKSTLRAFSRVTASAVDSPRPEEYDDQGWASDGWLVEADYVEFPTVISIDQMSDCPKDSGGPFDVNGAVKQGYLYPLRPDFLKWFARTFPGYLPSEMAEESLSENLAEGGVTSYSEPPLGEIIAGIRSSGLVFTDSVIERYHLSLKSKRIVILAGVSGTGKTSLAQAYAHSVGAQFKRVAVAPNWTTNEDLLGAYNLLEKRYVDTQFTSFLRDAEASYRKAVATGVTPTPYHILLDEMNLARVEYYFAEVLSAMEVKTKNDARSIDLREGGMIELTPNLSLIGTINVDETTQGFSDKVLDRAQVIEIPVNAEMISSRLEGTPYQDLITQLWKETFDVAPFGFRVIDDIRSYVEAAVGIGKTWQSALDVQLLQKVLPKINRADKRVRRALQAFEIFPLEDFPLTREKAKRMLEGFELNGFASYF
jgi:MoxR-like ATPase